MGWLNKLFNSEEKSANKTQIVVDAIYKDFKDYRHNFSYKKSVISNLQEAFGKKIQVVNEIKSVIGNELIDLKPDKETEIIADIYLLEHSKKIQRVQKLEACLGYAATKYEHVYELSRHLYSTLVSELELLDQIPQSDLRKYRKIIELFKKEVLIEEELLNQIGDIGTFHKLFAELVIGEHLIKRLDKSEKRLAELMNKDMPIDGITDRWVMAVFEGIEDKVYELVSNDSLDTHPNMHFEFVNRPEFIELVREKITIIRKRPVTDGMINAFAHLFREKYNREVE
jgi:hypothetical protein